MPFMRHRTNKTPGPPTPHLALALCLSNPQLPKPGPDRDCLGGLMAAASHLPRPRVLLAYFPLRSATVARRPSPSTLGDRRRLPASASTRPAVRGCGGPPAPRHRRLMIWPDGQHLRNPASRCSLGSPRAASRSRRQAVTRAGGGCAHRRGRPGPSHRFQPHTAAPPDLGGTPPEEPADISSPALSSTKPSGTKAR